MSVVLEAKNLSRSYQTPRGLFKADAEVKALSSASFELVAGRTLAVVGESGSGKSTLGRLLTMIETPSGGHLTIDGVDISQADAQQKQALRRTVQIVFQNPYGSLNPRKTIAQALEEPLIINTALSRAERKQAVLQMMQQVGLRPEFADRYPHMFSGGQRQRIAIARALMLRPKILVLDEPVSALDVSIRAQVLNLLADLQKNFGLAYVFISHDLSVVRHSADDVMVIYLGHVVELGSAKSLFANPQHPYTKALLSATPIANPGAKKERIVLQGEMPSPFNPPTGCAFHPRCALAQERCRHEAPALELRAGRAVACWMVEVT